MVKGDEGDLSGGQVFLPAALTGGRQGVCTPVPGLSFLQICAKPPSTNSSIPVTKLLSSEARNTTAFAISSGCPNRPIGTVAIMAALNCLISSAFFPKELIPGVSIGPGLMVLTRIL